MSDSTTPSTERPTELATLGGGCFWCLEAIFQQLPGVVRVTSGYAGGSGDRPTYQQVCTGSTGYAEVVQIQFDPGVITYSQLLDIFWRAHDPTTLNRQGHDVGTQYRSVIFPHDQAQHEAALAALEQAVASALHPNPIVTQIVPLTRFYPAESYHQNYFRNNVQAPYCQAVIVPKLLKLNLETH